MRTFAQSALTISVAAALLGGCRGSQPMIGAPQAVQRNNAMAPFSERVVYSFGGSPDGTAPEANLIDVKGVLYGTTSRGGKTKNHGTVFSVSTSGAERVLYNFGTPSDHGSYPTASLIDVGGTLYGTSQYGGAYHAGTVFSITTTGNVHVLHSFRGSRGSDGAFPSASLINVGGTLYGTTSTGGHYHPSTGYYGFGTVFSITTGGTEKVLHSFGSGFDGKFPLASLIDVKGTLYGTTLGGGRHGRGAGTVFSVSTSGTEKVLHSFGSGSDGSEPEAGLIEVNGTLYGTTAEGGGALAFGTVFSISTSGTEKVLHSFGYGTDGSSPSAALINENGTLYGTTFDPGGDGSVFSISTSGTEQIVYQFGGNPDGAHPVASLIDVNGTLYGTTEQGGTHGNGTVFALTP